MSARKPTLAERYQATQRIIKESLVRSEIDEAEENLLQMWKDHPEEMNKITSEDFWKERDRPAGIMSPEEAKSIGARAATFKSNGSSRE